MNKWGDILTEIFDFGKIDNESKVYLLKITNKSGAFVTITNYGCTIVSICVPDKNGVLTDVCLGYDTLEEYRENDGYLGMFVGRCANRIANGVFSLNGVTYKLAANNGVNHLHGGVNGFSSKVYDFEIKENTVKFTAVSRDGEEGYPGEMKITVEYTFTDDNQLIFNSRAVSSKDTIVNFTNHTYFDLNGQGSGKALEQKVQIFADGITEINENLIPTGKILPVKENKAFDFTEPKALKQDINMDDRQLKIANGYDHNFVLSGYYEKPYQIVALQKAARLIGEETSIVMDMYTTQPGMQMYTANFLTERKGKEGKIYRENDGVALETQNFPDAINHSDFPSPILKKGKMYGKMTVYKFSVI